MKKKLLLIPLALLLAISLVAIGCPAEEPPPPPPPTDGEPPPPPPPEREILIGAINCMTGIEAMVGTEHRWAYQEAVDDINAAGGIYVEEFGKKLPVRLIVVDDKSSIPEAAAAAEKLIKLEKVDFILGSCTSELNVSGYSVAEKYEKLYVCTTHWCEEHIHQYEEGMRWVATSFFYGAAVCESPALIMNTMPEVERPTKINIMSMDNPDGEIFAAGGEALCTAAGYEVIIDLYTVGTKDFSPSILKMKGEGIEALVFLGNSTDAITLNRQIKENNLNLRFNWGAKGYWPVEFADALGPDSDYIVSDAHWSPLFGFGRSEELADRFRAEFGATSVTIGNFYSIVEALADAIEQAGSLDSAKVRDVLYSGTFVAKDTTNGDLAFNEMGLAVIPPVGLQWMGGERMPVWPPAPEIWTLKWIPPWDER